MQRKEISSLWLIALQYLDILMLEKEGTQPNPTPTTSLQTNVNLLARSRLFHDKVQEQEAFPHCPYLSGVLPAGQS